MLHILNLSFVLITASEFTTASELKVLWCTAIFYNSMCKEEAHLVLYQSCFHTLLSKLLFQFHSFLMLILSKHVTGCVQLSN